MNSDSEDEQSTRSIGDEIPCRVCGVLSERHTMTDDQVLGYVGGENCRGNCYEIARMNRAHADKIHRRYRF
jgi:hypothetical protein